MVISSELFVWIFVFQSLLEVSGKGQVRRHVKEVWTFAQLCKRMKSDNRLYSRHNGSFRNTPNFDNRLANLEDYRETNNPIAYNLNS